ncbi:tRNA-specific adenosine deaminase 2 [Leguminivora glycinivorella]|uniref:tRNA-specific adenosine deaminase 2 n=1 Tax=Leguminivora glycinivorella TaxID=1035111 RepID=UPI002010A428|nr:tRNA-specific adenosine deaminase 2 [Leguminivora glycinivorella]
MVHLMKRALELAQEALVAQEVPVGCVFSDGEKIVAESRNCVNLTRNPTRHAEINCIDTVIAYCKTNNINYKELFPKITVYVTVEPCIMCAAALNDLHVKEVVYGCANDRFGGKTVVDVNSYYEHNYTLTGNLMADEAMALLKQFYKGVNPNAPEPKVKKRKDNE